MTKINPIAHSYSESFLERVEDQIEDFWKRYLLELKDGHKSHRQMGDSYLKILMLKVGRRQWKNFPIYMEEKASVKLK
ncbi:hypothetical protein SUGI_1004860 [Cryptomeria japonica]|nr:hypothetical protein SUGI_1004860 [Cryptomeria japonica]